MVEQIITNTKPDTSFFASLGLNWQSLLFWGFIFILIMALLLWGLFKLIKYLKEKKNSLIQLYKEKKNLCKQHRSKLYYKSFLKPSKNAPIVAQYFIGKKMFKHTIGYYYGHYISASGDINLLFARNNIKKWLFFPSLKVLLINLNSDKLIETYNAKTKKIETNEITLPNDYIQFLDDEIILNGVSGVDVLDEDNLFYIPVLHSKDGVDNLRFYFHESIKEPLLSSQYMNTLNFFINANKKIVDFNPFIKAKQKLGNADGSVETDNTTTEN